MSTLLHVDQSKIAGCVANSVDPDGTPRSVATHQSTLFAQVCLSEYLR